MPDKHPDTSKVIADSATALMVMFYELGFGDKPTTILDRGNELLDAIMTSNAADALGDDLDAYSVAVGFAAAMGVFASCLGGANGAVKLTTKTDMQEFMRQMRKAKDN